MWDRSRRPSSDAWAIYNALTGSAAHPICADLRRRTCGSASWAAIFWKSSMTMCGQIRGDAESSEGRRRVDHRHRSRAGCRTFRLRMSTSRSPKPLPFTPKRWRKAPAEFSHSVRSRLEMGGTISRDDYVKAQGDRVPVARRRRCRAVALRCARAADAADTAARSERRASSSALMKSRCDR